jgi:hypothetical protein
MHDAFQESGTQKEHNQKHVCKKVGAPIPIREQIGKSLDYGVGRPLTDLSQCSGNCPHLISEGIFYIRLD